MPATLTARPRTERGKNAARKLRAAGQVPAVVYGHGEESHAVTVDAHELERLLASISVENTLIELRLEGRGTMQALIREVQHHPVRPEVLHLDLFHVHATETLHVEVPIRLSGNPVGVRDGGGVLAEVLRELSVECLPGDIPEAVEINIESLDVGETVHVRDVTLPKVRILNDPDLVIVGVSHPTAAALPEGPETEIGPAEVEPALVRDRREAVEEA